MQFVKLRLLCGTGGRSNVVANPVENLDVKKSNSKELIQSTLYDQQTPYAAWKLYFSDQCKFRNYLECNFFCKSVVQFPFNIL